MTHSFKTIGIIGKHRSYDIAGTIMSLVDYLLENKKAVLLEAETARSLPKTYPLPTTGRHQLGAECDLVIVVGGDGCFLHAARVVAPHGTPMVGINRGHLGFLTDVLPLEIPERIGSILAGQYQEEKRFLLHADVIDQNNMLADGEALNEVALSSGDTPQLVEFEIYIDKRFMCRHRADGLLVSTPTGSTGYALSGGGPILHPELDALVLVPMFPHTLSNRPIVIDAKSTVDIIITERNQGTPHMSCDSQPRIAVPPGGRIFIQKSPHPLRLIHPSDHDYFETLRSKLGWVNKQ